MAGGRVLELGSGGADAFRRLASEQISRGVDAVDSDIPDGTSAQFALCPDVSLADLHAEGRVEHPQLANRPGPDLLDDS